MFAKRSVKAGIPWIDPAKCQTCGRCAPACSTPGSAVKCVNDFTTCSYCTYCYGYYPDDPTSNPDGRVCPTGALKRRRISEFEYEYTVDEATCTGCGECVKRCVALGNKSMRLEVRGRLCLECNRCGVIIACPNKAARQIELKT